MPRNRSEPWRSCGPSWDTASPINFNELYSVLQTKIVEGQENPLPIIAKAKLYEVQKFCSLTGHVWDPYLILANRAPSRG
jgi:TRAP-type C4-dicarboxylate transport system substrate-binding protein